jgi:hypothetical protein
MVFELGWTVASRRPSLRQITPGSVLCPLSIKRYPGAKVLADFYDKTGSGWRLT